MRGTAPESEGTRAARGPALLLGAGLVIAVLAALVDRSVGSWLYLVPLVAAAVAGVVAVRREGATDPSTTFLTAGVFVLIPAYVLWYPARLAWDLELGEPAITDALFLAGYVCFLIGLARRVAERNAITRRVEVVDTLIVSIGLGVLLWVVFISPYLQDDSMSVAAKGVAISYTVVDLLLLGAVVRLAVQRAITTIGERLLIAWVVAQLVADLTYAVSSLRGTFSLGHPVVDFYPVSFALLGAALLHPSTTVRTQDNDGLETVRAGRRFVMVAPAALIAPVVIAVLGVRDGSDDIPIAAGLSAGLFALVLARLWFLVVDAEEHRRIRQQLTASIEKERRRSEENQELLTSLRERQELSDRLSRIQRKISTRAPLQEVLDAITQGAADLLHDDVAALRFVDEDDPRFMLMVSSVGVDAAIAGEVERLPVGSGVGGRAIVDNRLCIMDSYTEWAGAIGQFATGGLQTAMAAPVHLGEKPIGSLVVATHRADRRYSEAEQEALIRFTEHVSIALNDARSVRAMNEALEHAVYQAMHDDLTGLPNRACFYDRAEQALRAARRDDSATAVLLFDLDRFKEINDTLGHRYGDRVLRDIGPRIAPLLRETDTLARLGGDEFCVLLPRVGDLTAAVEIANRIAVALEEPFLVDDLSLVVEASCGVTIAPSHGDTADLLLQRSDVAMYLAKTSHVSVVAYEDHLDRNTPDRLNLLGELRAGIGSDELELHYQPQVDLESGAVVGVEALVRWRHPRRGLLGPQVFVPIAEETGLIHQLTSWVLDAALEQLRCWVEDPRLAVGPDFTMAVNLSTHSLLDESFAVEVGVAIARSRMRPRQLVLEITETTLMADPARSRRVLDDLARFGVQFAIDDFGTGYSSLASLRDLPVHELKIDQSFVRCMHERSDDAVIVQSVIELGHTLGLRTVAEGVEADEVRDRLAALGCDSAQGFSIAPPMPPGELAAWIAGSDRQTTVVVG